MNKQKMPKVRKRILIAILLFLAVILILGLILSFVPPKVTTNNPNEISDIEELLAYYGCYRVSIVNGSEEPFQKDIYVTFGRDLITGEQSNEAYFNEIILHLTKLLNHENYRLIDQGRQTVIAVLCSDNKIAGIYINGELNYFAKQETEQLRKNFSPILETNMNITSQELMQMIQRNWKAEESIFGTRESRYNGYDIYFDEGIEVSTLGGKVYNLIFTEKYQKTIVSSLSVNSSDEEIYQILGTPTFEKNGVIGYKGNNFYIFFSKDQVSVYPKEENYQEDAFLTIFNTWQEDQDIKKFVNSLTNIWQDYNVFRYDTNSIFLEYALKGVRIEYNIGSQSGMFLYRNFGGTLGENAITLETMTKENQPKNVHLRTDEDLVAVNEFARRENDELFESDELRNITDETYTGEEETGINYRFTTYESTKFILDFTKTDNGIREVKLIAKNKDYPNSEITRHLEINYYGWKDDNVLIYSLQGVGIFAYHADTRKLDTIVSGSGREYILKRIEGNVLYYDNTSVRL